MVGCAKLLQIARRDIPELSEDGARFRPVPIRVVGDLAGHGFEAVFVNVGSELLVIQAVGLSNSLGKNLAGGVTERREAVSEWVDLLSRCFGTVPLEQFAQAREVEAR